MSSSARESECSARAAGGRKILQVSDLQRVLRSAPDMNADTAVRSFALFDTPIGRCGVAWNARGITCVQLPEPGDRAMRARLLGRFPDARQTAPPAFVQRAVAGVLALLRGEASRLDEVRLDMDGVPPFHRRVYEFARTIPPGATLSYGEVARRLGAPGAARAVGQALRRNPFAIVVPCHRVLASGGKVGGFTATGGVTTKLRLLQLEGAPLSALHAECPRQRSSR
jgi:methylated-DNA-[protein]-cysteine S-methyltransferase